MIEHTLITLPIGITYNDLKKPINFAQQFKEYCYWAFRWPFTIYSGDLKQKHTFQERGVKIQPCYSVHLEQKWKYFVITRSDNRKVYCTSYIFYQRCQIQVENNFIFSLNSSSKTLVQFYLPSCLVLKSQKPYFKLQTNLIKIHRQLRRKNPHIYIQTQLNRTKRQAQFPISGNAFHLHKKPQIHTLSSSKLQKSTPNQILLGYYLSFCSPPSPPLSPLSPLSNPHKLLLSSTPSSSSLSSPLHLLHLYPLPPSLYILSYTFHMPVSIKNLHFIISSILLQKQIIFISNNQNSNVTFMQSLLQIIKPLQWQFLYIPNIYEEILEIIQLSFMPYMIGVHRKYLDKISIESKIVVYTDCDRIQVDGREVGQGDEHGDWEVVSTGWGIWDRRVRWRDGKGDEKGMDGYLEWESQMRARAVVMVSWILQQQAKYRMMEGNQQDFQYYDYFFKKSAMFSTYKQQTKKQQNIEMNELLTMKMSQRILTIENRMQFLLQEARTPQIYQNSKQWQKYYEKNKEKTRKSLKNLRGSLVYDSSKAFLSTSVLLSSVAIQPQKYEHTDRRSFPINNLTQSIRRS